MNKDLKVIVEELLETLGIVNSITKVENTSDIHFYASEETLNSYKKYGKFSIEDIICLVRIERLFDLHYINEHEKEYLLKTYKDYKILSNVIGTFELDVLFDGSDDVDLSREDYHEMSERRDELTRKLNEFGIIESFNYEEAFFNQIDKDISRVYKDNSNGYLVKKNNRK